MRHQLTGTEDPSTMAKKINANFEELYSVAQASGAIIAPAPVAADTSQIPFSPVLQLNQVHRHLKMPPTKVSGGLRFSVGPYPVNTAETTVVLIANGDPSCIPNFGEFERRPGSSDWVNTKDTLNVITFSFLAGPHYEIRQVE